MKTKVEMRGEIAIVTPKGSLVGGSETMDLHATIRVLIDAGNKKLIVDLGKVDLMTSRGISVMVEAHVNYTNRGGVVILCDLDRIKNVFVVTRLISILTIEETLEGALRKLGGS